MLVGLIGDLEGEREAAVDCLRLLGERGDVAVAFQLGDLRFGYGPDPDGYLNAIESMCAEYGIELLCITGNHENWALLDALWADPRWQDPDGTLRPIVVRSHVKMLPRGFRCEMGGRSFVALGSAPSVNRGLLTEGVDWWPSEVLLEEHVEATIAGGRADVMLTHDSPAVPYCTGPVANIMAGNPMAWPDEILDYAEQGIERVTRAVLGVHPRLLVHGHFHVAGEAEVRLPDTDHNTTIWSLAARRDPGNLRVLDLDTLTDPQARAAPRPSRPEVRAAARPSGRSGSGSEADPPGVRVRDRGGTRSSDRCEGATR